MRTLLQATIDTASGNKTITDGSLPKMLQSIMDVLKPEASYFFAADGCRSCLFVFDMKDASEIPVIVEPLFTGVNAKVSIQPVMNADDLQKGLAALQKIK